MSRKHRIWYPGAIYHITARGNRRVPLFELREDYLMYLELIQQTKLQFPFQLHAYCLMTNHIHLQLETNKTHIKEIMKELHSRYAMYFNATHGYDGHLFQGRYGASLIDTDAYFLEVSRYIHLNPFEAKMVPRPQDYPWSSYHSYITQEINPYITTSKVLGYFSAPQHENYRRFVEGIDL